MGETANTPDTGTDSGANTLPTISERAERLARAADEAPAFGGIRGHLTEAACFAQVVAAELAELRADLDKLRTQLGG